MLKDCKPILDAASVAAIVLMAPTPRYVRNGCCENPDHISNIESDSYEEELHLVVSHFRAAVATLPAANICRIFDVCQRFGQGDYSAKDVDTGDGLSIWLSRDPVHPHSIHESGCRC